MTSTASAAKVLLRQYTSFPYVANSLSTLLLFMSLQIIEYKERKPLRQSVQEQAYAAALPSTAPLGWCRRTCNNMILYISTWKCARYRQNRENWSCRPWYYFGACVPGTTRSICQRDSPPVCNKPCSCLLQPEKIRYVCNLTLLAFSTWTFNMCSDKNRLITLLQKQEACQLCIISDTYPLFIAI